MEFRRSPKPWFGGAFSAHHAAALDQWTDHLIASPPCRLQAAGPRIWTPRPRGSSRSPGAADVAGILLSTPPNFAWLTGGATNRIDVSRETGAGHCSSGATEPGSCSPTPPNRPVSPRTRARRGPSSPCRSPGPTSGRIPDGFRIRAAAHLRSRRGVGADAVSSRHSPGSMGRLPQRACRCFPMKRPGCGRFGADAGAAVGDACRRHHAWSDGAGHCRSRGRRAHRHRRPTARAARRVRRSAPDDSASPADRRAVAARRARVRLRRAWRARRRVVAHDRGGSGARGVARRHRSRGPGIRRARCGHARRPIRSATSSRSRARPGRRRTGPAKNCAITRAAPSAIARGNGLRIPAAPTASCCRGHSRGIRRCLARKSKKRCS